MVELAGEELDGEGMLAFFERELRCRGLDLWLGENERGSLGEFVIVQAIEIVSLNDASAGDGVDGKVRAEIGDEVLRFGGEFGGFFNEKAVHGSEAIA